MSLWKCEESWHDLATVLRFLMSNAWLVLEANHDMIWENATRFMDKICVLWVVHKELWHDFGNCDTILAVAGHYLSISVHFLRERFKRGKLGKSKEAALGLRVFDKSSLGLGNMVNTLGEWKPLSVLFIGEIEKMGRNYGCSLWACWS